MLRLNQKGQTLCREVWRDGSGETATQTLHVCFLARPLILPAFARRNTSELLSRLRGLSLFLVAKAFELG